MSKQKTFKMVTFLVCVFFVPFFIAWYLFFYTDHAFLKFSNHGELISTPFQLSRIKLTDYEGKQLDDNAKKWTVVYWTNQACDQNCKSAIDKLFRVRLRLGKEMLRTQAYLVTIQPLSPEMLKKVEDVNGFNTQPLLMKQEDEVETLLVSQKKNIVLVDPNGNVMMRYAQNVAPEDVLSDLKRLLKVSKIG